MTNQTNPNKASILCIYHSPCNDGFTAAWIVHNYHKSYNEAVELYPTTYNQAPPLELCKGKKVYIVDFSYPAWDLQQICDVAESVILIDHHKTALPLLSPDLGFPDNLSLNIDMSRSGAALTWEHFYNDINVNTLLLLVRYVEDRDMWWKTLEHCDDIHYALTAYEPEISIWNILAQQMDTDEGLAALISEGAAIRRWITKWIESYIPDAIRSVHMQGYIVPCINVPGIFASDVGNILAKQAPFAVTWWESKDSIKYSLRSDKDSGRSQDVSKIAQAYGGGGHYNAAGFTIPKADKLIDPTNFIVD